ncbi:MAG: dTDP-glucose 4,6-dehydratase [Thermomicrobiales bacterium]|nr:dTDP-glucose 4,6-dehydratase [Thermomicrobiales bacterium]
MRILVTGAAGFIGSAYVHHLLRQHPDDELVALDLLTYAGNLANLAEVRDDPRFRFVQGDIADAELVARIAPRVDAIVNFAAETHVDRSLLDPAAFARANVTGVMTLLEAARTHGLRMLQVSTDEVYGHIPEGEAAREEDPLRPRSPYSAAKAGAELMCQAYVTSYGADVVVTRGANTIGPRQYPEKLVPLFVTNALLDLPLPVYGDGRQVRNWLHAEDHAAAIDLVLRNGASGAAYNVGADNERENLDVVHAILDRLGKPRSLLRHVEDRPGHDRRYGIDTTRIREELGWRPRRDWQQTLDATIDWYVSHPEWWRAVREHDPRFREFYDRQYAHRLAAAAAE